MKKTIIALLALGYTAAAAGVATDNFTFTTDENGNPNPVQLANEYDLTKDWTLSFSCVASPKTAANQYGTAIISSETNPGADAQNIQIYAKIDGNTTVVKANTRTDKFNTTVKEGSAWGTGSEAMIGAFDFTLQYTAAVNSITLTIIDAYDNTAFEETFEGVVFDANDTLTTLTTGITKDQLDAKVYDMYPAWTLPSGSFTGTALNIPEPTTATLSLLALAGLAARRRRK